MKILKCFPEGNWKPVTDPTKEEIVFCKRIYCLPECSVIYFLICAIFDVSVYSIFNNIFFGILGMLSIFFALFFAYTLPRDSSLWRFRVLVEYTHAD